MEKMIIGIAAAITVEIESERTQTVVERAAFWAELPATCPVCQNAVLFTYRQPKGFDYYGMQCVGSPAHETTFGEYKAPRVGLYYKRSWTLAHEHAGEENGNGQESTDEHRRLDGLIADAYGRVPRSKTFAESVRARFKKEPVNLTIAEKEQILASLEAV